ncbi:MAG: hypothetical protein ACE5EA_03705 [Nitrospirota bacterium]
MNVSELEKIKKILTKTGHVFEYQVCDKFEKAGWMIIPNKFYLDKDEEKGREIDLIAYQISEVRDQTAVVTVIIVESKQSTKNKWVFFTKGEFLGSVNIDNYPLFYLNEIDEFDKYVSRDMLLNELKKNNLNMIFDFDHKAYCYSAVVEDRNESRGKSNYRPVNPTDIYGAIFPVIKALTSELEFYKNRKIARNEKRFYWMIPLVVYNGEMLEARIRDGKIDLERKEEFQYITRYRSKYYDDFYSVNIINWNLIDKYVAYYKSIHECMVGLISKNIKRFYSEIDTKTFELIWDNIIEHLHTYLYFSGFTRMNFYPSFYNPAREELEIVINDPAIYKTTIDNPQYYKGKIEKVISDILNRSIEVVFINVPIPH